MITPPDDSREVRSYILPLNFFFFAIQILISQTAHRRPVNIISGWVQVWHEKLTQISHTLERNFYMCQKVQNLSLNRSMMSFGAFWVVLFLQFSYLFYTQNGIIWCPSP